MCDVIVIHVFVESVRSTVVRTNELRSRRRTRTDVLYAIESLFIEVLNGVKIVFILHNLMIFTFKFIGVQWPAFGRGKLFAFRDS